MRLLVCLLFVACASAPPPVAPVPLEDSVAACVVQDAVRSDGAVLVDGPHGPLIAQPRPEGDGTFELIEAATHATLMSASLGPSPSLPRAMPDPAMQVLCASRVPLVAGGERVVGVWDLARRGWRWTAPTSETSLVLAGRDRCFFKDGASLVARALDDGAELGRVPFGLPGSGIARVTRGTERLLIEQDGRGDTRIQTVLDGTSGALLTWFAARCATLAGDRFTVAWPDHADATEAAARAHAERKLGALLTVVDHCAPAPAPLPTSSFGDRLPWPWLRAGERIVAHVAAGLFVWDLPSAPRRLDATPPPELSDVNGKGHPLTPALAPDGAWVGVVAGTDLRRWTLDGVALDALPLPSVKGLDDVRQAAWQVFVGPLHGTSHPLAVLRNDPKRRALYLGDDAHAGLWRPTNARLFSELWPMILWPRATPDALLLAEPHYGPQVFDLHGALLGRFAPTPTMSRVRPFVVAGDRLLVAVAPSSGADDEGVYVLGLPRLEVITRRPLVASATYPEVDGRAAETGVRLVAQAQRDAYDLIDGDGARTLTLGLVDGHGWVEDAAGNVRCDGAACARYRVVHDWTSAPLTSERCVLAR